MSTIPLWLNELGALLWLPHVQRTAVVNDPKASKDIRILLASDAK